MMVKLEGVIETCVLSLSVTTMLTLADGMVKGDIDGCCFSKFTRISTFCADGYSCGIIVDIRAGDRGTHHGIITCNAAARVNDYCVAYIVIVVKIIYTCDSNSL